MKKIVIILSVLICISLIGNGVLIVTVIRNNKKTDEKLVLFEKQITDKENELSETIIKMEELNTSIQTLNGQLEEYEKQVDDFTNKECFYIEPVKESTKYVTDDTPFIAAIDFNKIGRLSRGQAVTIIGQVTNNLREGTHWNKVRLADNSEVFVCAKYLSDDKPAEVTTDKSANAKTGNGSTAGKTQEQIDFEKKIQDAINSGKIGGPAEHGTGGVAKFDDGGKTHVDLQLQ